MSSEESSHQLKDSEGSQQALCVYITVYKSTSKRLGIITTLTNLKILKGKDLVF